MLRPYLLVSFYAGAILASCSLFSSKPSPAETAGLIREGVALTARLCGDYRASGAEVPPDVQRACDTFVAVRCDEPKGSAGSAGAAQD